MNGRRYSIFGAGDLAYLVFRQLIKRDVAHEINFVVDAKVSCHPKLSDKKIFDLKAFRESSELSERELIFAIGYRNPEQKARALANALECGLNIVNFSFTNLTDGDLHFRGLGNLVLPDVILESGVRAGNGNVFWSGSHLCHDIEVGDCNFFAAGSVIGGSASIGNNNFFGLSSTTRDHLVVKDNVTIGMGTVVVRDIEKSGVYAGNPARLRER